MQEVDEISYKVSKDELYNIIAEEKEKCKNDYIYCLLNYGVIQHPTKGKIPFKLYDFQEKTLRALITNRFNIVLKARQLGITTLVAGLIACEMIFKDAFMAFAIATKGETAKNIVKKVKLFLKGFPPQFVPKITTDNKSSLELANGSFIKASGTSDDAGRSEAISLLIFDETAFINNVEDIWTAAYPTLSTGGNCISMSTPNGVGNWFHKEWRKTDLGESDFNPIKLPWYLHPDRDVAWRKAETRRLGKKKAAQENDCDFVSSGHTVVEGEIIKEMSDNTTEPKLKKGGEENLWIWKNPIKGHKYLVTGDVASGGGGDYSAAHVIDLVELEQVAEFKGKLPPSDYGKKLMELGYSYNMALIVIENNGLGLAAIQPLLDEGYRNLYWSKKGSIDWVDPNDLYTIQTDKNVRPGFSTNARTRNLVIDKLEQYTREQSIKINSKRTIDELWTFTWTNGKAQAMDGYNDDLVMALSIGLWVRDTALRLMDIEDDYHKQKNNWIIRTYDEYDPLYSAKNDKENPYQINVGNQVEDISWIFSK